MRRALLLSLALGALIAVTVAGIATAGSGKPTKVIIGNLELVAGGGFSPTTL